MGGGIGNIIDSTQGVDISIAAFTDSAGQMLAWTNRSPTLNAGQFYSNCAPLVADTLKARKSAVRNLQVSNSLVEVAVVPCFDSAGSLFGALVFGVDVND